MLGRPTAIKDDWTIEPQYGGKVYRNAPTVIALRPGADFLRVPWPSVENALLYYHGLVTTLPRWRLFDRLLSHEARHCWQYELRVQDAKTDNDLDFLPVDPPPSSPELADNAYDVQGIGLPFNPEFNFLGDDTAQTSDYYFNAPSWSAAVEHNADRFAAANIRRVNYPTEVTLTCAQFRWASFTLETPPGGGPPNPVGRLNYLDDSGTDKALTGVLVKVERRATPGDCASQEGWTLVSYQPTDGLGAISLAPTADQHRLTVIPPPECPSNGISVCWTPQ